MGNYKFIPVNAHQVMDTLKNAPWELYMAPFRCAPHVWYVGGQWWVSCFLIDTGDGLILIDTGMRTAQYLLVDSIYRAGFRVDDIKMILVSHAHGDHCDCVRCMAELSGAEVWMSREDDEFKRDHFEGVYMGQPGHDFTVNHYFSDEEPIRLGNITIRTRLCAGHTPGTTSFFFEDRDEQTGKVYRCAMHGGAGTRQIENSSLDAFGLPHSLRDTFIRNCLELQNEPVDICLASHNRMCNFTAGLNEQDRTDYSGFVDPDTWRLFMQDLVAQARAIAEKEDD